MPMGERFYYRHKRQVIDGTKCDEEQMDICLNGKCLVSAELLGKYYFFENDS
jgi:hypothetical protein